MGNFPIFAGLFAAIIHVVSGPDHLAAITPMTIEAEKKPWKIGLFWGIGHLCGMLLIGLLFLAFKDVIPVEAISERSEQLVGVVLIGVGVWALYKLFYKSNKKQHAHRHKNEQKNLWSSFAIGVLHGLAGVAHFLLLLPVLGFKNSTQSGFYIVGFAVGTVLAMIAYSFLLGVLTKASKHNAAKNLTKGIQLAGGLFALVVGIYWISLGF